MRMMLSAAKIGVSRKKGTAKICLVIMECMKRWKNSSDRHQVICVLIDVWHDSTTEKVLGIRIS